MLVFAVPAFLCCTYISLPAARSPDPKPSLASPPTIRSFKSRKAAFFSSALLEKQDFSLKSEPGSLFGQLAAKGTRS